MSPAEQYSGELLAYLLQVVLGRAGQPESREEWRMRAIHEPLDFARIAKSMTDPEENRLDYMVLDPNILDLSQVLFHYDEDLSLYKGDYGVTSVFPAPEVLAVRLFILKRIRSGEKISLDAFIRREEKLLDASYQPKPEDLAATGLSALEMKFLRDVFQSEPSFYRYLTSPFLLKELARIGILAPGSHTEEIIRSGRYTPSKCTCKRSQNDGRIVKIALLPSMTKEFLYGKGHGPLSVNGFKATEFLQHIFAKLKKEILETTRKNLRMTLSKPPYPVLTETEWLTVWQLISEKYIVFCLEDKRPLVVYPQNAQKVMDEVCPEANFTVILLGKNTYRALFIDPATDSYPAVDRLYMDIFDIEYDQAGDQIETISRFICSRLKKWIAASLAPATQ